MSRALLRAVTVAIIATGVGLAGCGGAKSTGTSEPPAKVADPAASRAAFLALGEVLTHPRCLNCHPSDDSPTQGDAMEPHQPPVVRGEGGMGAVGMRCGTCHGETNVPLTERAGTMPGTRGWHLAPASMGWQGKSLAQICEQIKDESRNGGKTLEQLYEHMAHDALVGWAWAPGEGLSPAPGTHEQFGQLTREWIDNGAHCPAP